jgi:hypothetical protein
MGFFDWFTGKQEPTTTLTPNADGTFTETKPDGTQRILRRTKTGVVEVKPQLYLDNGDGKPVRVDSVDDALKRSNAGKRSAAAAGESAAAREGTSPNIEFAKKEVQENIADSTYGAKEFSSVRQENASFSISKFRSEVGYSDSVLPTHSFLAVFSPFKDVITARRERTTSEIRQEIEVPFTISQRVTLRCDNVILPNMGLLQEQNIRRYGYGTVENVAYGVNPGDITMQFIVDNKSDVLFFFEDWFDRVVNRDSKGGADMRSVGKKDLRPYQVGYKDDYACPAINVFVYDRSNRNIFEYNIYDAYPVNLQSINLSWADENSLLKLNVTFAFTDFKINRPRKTTAQETSDQMREQGRKELEERIANEAASYDAALTQSLQQSSADNIAELTRTIGNITVPQVEPSSSIKNRNRTTTSAARQSAANETTIKNTQGDPVN